LRSQTPLSDEGVYGGPGLGVLGLEIMERTKGKEEESIE